MQEQTGGKKPMCVVTTLAGSRGFVNLDQVDYIVRNDRDKFTEIHFHDNPASILQVQQTPDEIMTQMGIETGELGL